MATGDQPRFTFLGKLVSTLLIGGLFYLGYTMVQNRGGLPWSTGGGQEPAADTSTRGEVSEVQMEVPRLAPAAPYEFKDSTVAIEISEYAGYAGLIAANGGLDPNPQSAFTKAAGYKVKLTISEEESWSALNSGKLAASVTTVDVLAVYGR